jgi:hypothetical protein
MDPQIAWSHEVRKLIRLSAVAFLVWAITTLAWAALSHMAGTSGPARASAASMELVASAVTFIDPPGALGAPQRFAARQIRGAARAVERFHRVPERAVAELVDALGHRHRHGRGGRHYAFRVQADGSGRGFTIPIDELDRVRDRARALADVELERHRGEAERLRGKVERQRGELERRRGELERRRGEMERRRGEMERVRTEFSFEFQNGQRERLMRTIEQVAERLSRLDAEQDGDVRRKWEDRLREILRDLERELEDVNAQAVESIMELDGLDLSEVEGVPLDGPVRIHIRRR